MFTRRQREITNSNPQLLEMFKIVVAGLVEQHGGTINKKELDQGAQDAEYIPGSYSVGMSVMDLRTPTTAAAIGMTLQKISGVTGLKPYVDDETCSAGLQGRDPEMVMRALVQLGRNLEQLGLPDACYEKAVQAYLGSFKSQGRRIS